MQRAFGSQGRELAMVSDASPGPVVGRIAAKGLTGELHDKPYLVIDGMDGRGHHVYLPKATELGDLPIDGIVEVRAGVESVADRNIAATAQGGCYLRREHVRQLRSAGRNQGEAEAMVEGHIRRLEALRRTGIVERVADGFWRVPADLVDRGRAFDHGRGGNVAYKVHCHLPIEEQIRAVGATWLDQQLVDQVRPAETGLGFARAVQEALNARAEFLVEQGFAERRGPELHTASNLLGTLRARDIEAAAKSISAHTGLKYHPVADGSSVSGSYRRSVSLASGRFAMLDNGLGFSLVPWRPSIEKTLGRTITATIRGDAVSWQLGRHRGLSI